MNNDNNFRLLAFSLITNTRQNTIQGGERQNTYLATPLIFYYLVFLVMKQSFKNTHSFATGK